MTALISSVDASSIFILVSEFLCQWSGLGGGFYMLRNSIKIPQCFGMFEQINVELQKEAWGKNWAPNFNSFDTHKCVHA